VKLRAVHQDSVTFETKRRMFRLSTEGVVEPRSIQQLLVALFLSPAVVPVIALSLAMGELEAGYERYGMFKEHLSLALRCGARHVIICLSKLDGPDVQYSESRYDEAAVEVRSYLPSAMPHPTPFVTTRNVTRSP
jgi:translation elongation factor EF-1alpha